MCAALLIAATAAPALADDPLDPEMATSAARERDRAIIRRLNQDQLAYVRERDAGYASGWQAYRDAYGDRPKAPRGQYIAADDAQLGEAAPARQPQDRGSQAYARALSDYDAAMADWRRDVADCRAGYYERCAR